MQVQNQEKQKENPWWAGERIKEKENMSMALTQTQFINFFNELDEKIARHQLVLLGSRHYFTNNESPPL